MGRTRKRARKGVPMSARTPAHGTHRYTGHCAATGKAQFVRRRDAKAAMRETPGRHHVYPCKACGYFEIGSQGGRPRADHRELNAKRYSDQQ
jgi:hypothetical protein